MQKFDGNFVILDMEETYSELGEHSFKIILNPKIFKNSHDIDIKMFDPDSNPMIVDTRKWGRKVQFNFNIDKNVSNGVCIVRLHLMTDKKQELIETLHYWIIK